MSIQGTSTEKNLLTAFAGESQARNRYTYYAKQAQKEGFIQISRVFEETAAQELSHAKSFFKPLEGGAVEVTASFPAGVIGTTAENLRAAVEGEQFEHESLYPQFSFVAREEGFPEIAALFKSIAVAEKHHGERFRALLSNLEDGTVFKKDEPVQWYCIKCGYVYEGTEALPKCPACAHPQAWFEVRAQNW